MSRIPLNKKITHQIQRLRQSQTLVSESWKEASNQSRLLIKRIWVKKEAEFYIFAQTEHIFFHPATQIVSFSSLSAVQDHCKKIISEKKTYRNLWKHSGFQTCSGAGRSGPFCSGNASSLPGLPQGTFQPAYLHPQPGGCCSQGVSTDTLQLLLTWAHCLYRPTPLSQWCGRRVEGHICGGWGPQSKEVKTGEHLGVRLSILGEAAQPQPRSQP